MQKPARYEMDYHLLLEEFYLPDIDGNKEMLSMFWRVANDLAETKIIKPSPILPTSLKKEKQEKLDYDALLEECKTWRFGKNSADGIDDKLSRYLNQRQLRDLISFRKLRRSRSL